jgi:hypothetical protein
MLKVEASFKFFLLSYCVYTGIWLNQLGPSQKIEKKRKEPRSMA